MTKSKREEALRLIDRLTKEIALAQRLAFTEAAHALNIAKMALMLAAHDISDDEFREFNLRVAQIWPDADERQQNQLLRH